MGLFLQIIGGVVLTLILIVVGVFIFLKIKFGQWLKLDPDQNHTPLRIHLNEDFVAGWMKTKEPAVANGEMLALGFKRGKSYTVPEMPDLNLTAYFKGSIIGVMYKHTAAGVWVDFAVESADIELTFSNGPIGSGTENRPEKQINWLQDHSIPELFQALSAKLDPTATYKTVDESDFRAYFESSYRKDMAYRARNGGMSHEEFLRHVEEMGKTFSDKELDQAFSDAKLQEIEQWSEAALEEFIESKSADEKERFYNDGDSYLIVPFTSHAPSFIRYLEDMGILEDDAVEELSKKFKEEKDLFFLFDLLNAGRSPELRAKQVGESDYPLKMKIFGFQYT